MPIDIVAAVSYIIAVNSNQQSEQHHQKGDQYE